MGLLDKAKDAAEQAKEKLAPLLDKGRDKTTELSKKEGIVGKVAGSVDKAVKKQGEGTTGTGTSAATTGGMVTGVGATGADIVEGAAGKLSEPGRTPSVDDPLPGQGLVNTDPDVPLDPAGEASGFGGTSTSTGFGTGTGTGTGKGTSKGSGFGTGAGAGIGGTTDLGAADPAAVASVTDPDADVDPAGVAGLADPAPDADPLGIGRDADHNPPTSGV